MEEEMAFTDNETVASEEENRDTTRETLQDNA
jgi:hypothetical protein